MPFQDASNDVARNNSGSNLHRKTLSKSGSSISSGPIPPPVAVQSMLRTATELGDIGNLAFPTARVFHPGSRLQSTRPRSGSFDSSFASALHHHRSPRDRPSRYHNALKRRLSSPGRFRHGTGQLSIAQHISAHNTGAPRSSKRHSQLQGLTSPQDPIQNLHTHRSLLTLRSYGEAQSRHSGSVSSRSIRSNKRRYRELYPSSLHHNPSYLRKVDFVSNRSSASSSPAILNARAGFPASRSQVSRSVSSLTCCPPSVQSGTNRAVNTVESSRISHLDEAQSESMPRYYDYSESFIEEECSSSNRKSLERAYFQPLDQNRPASKVESRLLKAQTPFGTRLGSRFFPAELPTKHNRRSSEASNKPIIENSAGQNLSLTRQNDNIAIAELPANSIYLQDNGKSLNEPTKSVAGVHHGSVPFYRANAKSKSGTFFHSSERSRRDLVTLAARVHSPVSDLVPCQVNQDNGNSGMPGKSRGGVTKGLGISVSECESLPSLSSEITVAAIANESNRTHTLNVPPPELEIFSPQPQRPVSSKSRQHFEQILQSSNDVNQCIDQHISGKNQQSRCASSPSTIRRGAITDNIGGLHEADCCREKAQTGVTVKLDRLNTPQAGLHLSLATSHGKSTIDSLLEKHIESLGLMPEPSESSTISELEFSPKDHTSKSAPQTVRTSIWLRSSGWPESISSGLKRSSSLSSETRLRMKPRKLFASMDGHISAYPEPVISLQKQQAEITGHNLTYLSYGWQSLPSHSYVCSQPTSQKPTVTSGEMADIDTEVYPLGSKIWRPSEFSLPTSVEDQAPSTDFTKRNNSLHARSHSKLLARAASRHRRHVRVRIKQKKRLEQLHEAYDIYKPGQIAKLYRFSRSSVPGYIELDGEHSAGEHNGILTNQPQLDDGSVPNRWSSIIAAMPMPGTGLPIIARQASTHTDRSQRSFRSQINPVEPLNSTRQRSLVPRLSGTIPRLARPDLGPRLDTSTLNLSIPYAEVPSTIYPSLQDNRSFFEDSPARAGVFRKSTKRQFGLRPLKSSLRRRRASSTCVKAGLPSRNGIPIVAIGSAINAASQQDPYTVTSPVKAEEQWTSMHGQKMSVVDRLKNWWRRQCMPKVITLRKRRKIQRPISGVLV